MKHIAICRDCLRLCYLLVKNSSNVVRPQAMCIAGSPEGNTCVT